MSFVSEVIAQYVTLSPQCVTEVESKFTRVELPKKEKLVTMGDLANKLVLVEHGYLRMYNIDRNGKESTVWIGGHGKFITSISSFVNRIPSRWTIESITDSTVYVIKSDSHFELCRKYREWLDFENLLLAKAISALEYRTFELTSMKAEDRYLEFFKRNAQLFLDIPSKYIASLLGISEETLSRLKRNN